jgi:hypothetical protein
MAWVIEIMPALHRTSAPNTGKNVQLGLYLNGKRKQIIVYVRWHQGAKF